MPDLSVLADLRDIVVIVFGIVSLVALLLFIVFTVLVGLAAWSLLKTVRRTIKDELGPILVNVQDTTKGVKGTTIFVGDTVVAPIIRVYSTVAGIRRALGVLARAGGRKGRA